MSAPARLFCQIPLQDDCRYVAAQHHVRQHVRGYKIKAEHLGQVRVGIHVDQRDPQVVAFGKLAQIRFGQGTVGTIGPREQGNGSGGVGYRFARYQTEGSAAAR